MTSFCIILLAISIIFINITLFIIGKKVMEMKEDLEKLWDAKVVIDLKMQQFEIDQKNTEGEKKDRDIFDGGV